nr:immunoglobulin light chain junction region [Macaca mulatta]MOW73953.1 immunoglobulin light chain junction region [Macaca mulatta]
CQKYSSWPWTF